MSVYKVVLLGEGRVGKSSIGHRWYTNGFNKGQQTTVAAALFEKKVRAKSGKELTIQLWDTAGQEQFHSLAPIYYKDASVALLVYSIEDRNGFEKISQWKKELSFSRGESIKIIIVANKCDLEKERAVAKEEGKSFADGIKCPFFECSAKTGEGIEPLFVELSNTLSSMSPPHPVQPKGKMNLDIIEAKEVQEKDGCC